MQPKRFSLIRRVLLPLIIVVLVVGIVGNLQAVNDFAKLYHYTPPTDVATIADQTTMTEKARRLFYVNHPVIASKATFNTACNNRGEQTIVLGCYHASDNGIYVYDVTDTRLNGVEQVTAAHEMLHAAYERLSGKERTSINMQLRIFYDTEVHDQRIRDTIAAYQKSEPDDVVNEMHSIFATEIQTLPPKLQTYYQQYFSNRAAVVGYASTYQAEFTSRQDQVKEYDTKLKQLKARIDSNTVTLKIREAAINSKQHELDRLRNSGETDAYNAEVPAYNTQVDQYNALIRTTQSLIAEYNSTVTLRNNVALEVRDLTHSINSSFETL